MEETKTDIISLLFIGDIMGRPGREAVKALLPQLRQQYQLDFVIANGENAAGGRGLTPKVAEELFGVGVDAFTSGNHIWYNKEIYSLIERETRVLRPLNYPQGAKIPGRGWHLYQTKSGRRIGVLNLLGRVFMQPYESPFWLTPQILQEIKKQTPLIVVDFHGEATSEKVAMGWLLDGEVTAVIGTHTHIQTADERVLPKGTAYITDAGMTGPYDSVIGVRKEIILEGYLTMMPIKHQLASGDVRLCGVLIQADADSGRAVEIERLCLPFQA